MRWQKKEVCNIITVYALVSDSQVSVLGNARKALSDTRPVDAWRSALSEKGVVLRNPGWESKTLRGHGTAFRPVLRRARGGIIEG